MKIKNYNHPIGKCREFYYCGDPVAGLGGKFAQAHIIPMANGHWLLRLEGYEGLPGQFVLTGHCSYEYKTYRAVKIAMGKCQSAGFWDREALYHGSMQLA